MLVPMLRALPASWVVVHRVTAFRFDGGIRTHRTGKHSCGARLGYSFRTVPRPSSRRPRTGRSPRGRSGLSAEQRDGLLDILGEYGFLAGRRIAAERGAAGLVEWMTEVSGLAQLTEILIGELSYYAVLQRAVRVLDILQPSQQPPGPRTRAVGALCYYDAASHALRDVVPQLPGYVRHQSFFQLASIPAPSNRRRYSGTGCRPIAGHPYRRSSCGIAAGNSTTA